MRRSPVPPKTKHGVGCCSDANAPTLEDSVGPESAGSDPIAVFRVAQSGPPIAIDMNQTRKQLKGTRHGNNIELLLVN